MTLTWNGVAQSPVTFSTTGHSPGDVYLLNTQVASPVTTTGVYPWTITIQATLPGGNIVQSTISGTTAVVVNGSTDPIGRGWSVGGTAQLIPDGNGGYFWVDGDGGTRDFQAGNGTTFVSPPNDFGTLVKNSNGTFTYTDPGAEPVELQQLGPAHQHHRAGRAVGELHVQLVRRSDRRDHAGRLDDHVYLQLEQ